jgi:hypothetical protein
LINLIGSVLRSSTTASIFKGGHAGVKSIMNQQRVAPSLALGGSLVAGVAAMFIGGFKIADCLRYQTKQGECDAAIERNLPAVIGGGAAIAGSWGGFNTYNPGLRKEDQPGEVAERGLVVDAPEPQGFHSASPEYIKELAAKGMNQTEISKELGISRYMVRKALQQLSGSDRGR